MGVDVTYYTVVGIKVDETNEELMEKIYDEFWKYRDDNDDEDTFEGITVVYDGMCGKYAVVGKVLMEMDEYEGGFLNINLDDLPDTISKTKESIRKWFSFGEELVENNNVTVMVFTHFS